ncbi:MAG: ABC transporter permease [Spirochaetales bacterium]|nr:ABC transporter permease [Spirochaetales bacterium]
MMYYLTLAFRNIFRNARRTIISCLVISIGIAALILIDAIFLGTRNNVITSNTSSFLGLAQIHNGDFKETSDANKTINNYKEIETSLSRESEVAHYTGRAVSIGMASSAANVRTVMLTGINPETEQHVSRLSQVIVDGDYISGSDERGFLIGDRLAEILDVSLGDRVVVTGNQANNGSLFQELFRVTGIFHFNIREMDTGMIFAHVKTVQRLLNIGDNYHEIAIQFKNIDFVEQKDNTFFDRYSVSGNQCESWHQYLPELKSYLDASQYVSIVAGFFLFLIVSFGIVNTIFMSLYERMFEFGIMRSMGTRSFKMVSLILYEVGALALLGALLGSLFGFIVTFILSNVGMDYRGVEFAGATMTEILYPILHVKQFIIYPLSAFILTVLVGVYPALFSVRVPISRMLREY